MVPSRLVRDYIRVILSHAQKGYLMFPSGGGVANHFPKRVIDQNVYLDSKVKIVRSNISTFEHCTNSPHMEKLEHILVMSEMPTVQTLDHATIL